MEPNMKCAFGACLARAESDGYCNYHASLTTGERAAREHQHVHTDEEADVNLEVSLEHPGALSNLPHDEPEDYSDGQRAEDEELIADGVEHDEWLEAQDDRLAIFRAEY